MLDIRHTRSLAPRRGSSILAALLLLLLSAPAAATIPLNPDNCHSGSVLPQMFQAAQTADRWIGLAVTAENPAQDVHLRAWSDAFGSGQPLHVSSVDGGSNFLLRHWSVAADGPYAYVEAFAPDGMNHAYLADFSPGRGELAAGAAVAEGYGGIYWECGLVRVWSVSLAAGQNYSFDLATDRPGDDLRMALFRAGGGQNGWLARADALWELAVAADGGPTTQTFTAPAAGSYALVVISDEVLSEGGTYTLGYDTAAPPAEPDLVVAAIEPSEVGVDEPVTALITVMNQGGAAAGASQTSVSVDGVPTCAALPTPALAPGASIAVQCALGSFDNGSVTLSACADAADAVDEGAAEGNNCRSIPLYIQELPDLVIESIAPDTAVEGEPIQAWISVRNQGLGNAGPSATRVSVNGSLRCGAIPTPALGAGQSQAVLCNLGAYGAGSIAVEATANADSAIDESQPGNNTSTEPILVASTAQPDLIVERIDPDTAGADEDIWVTAYVRNQGGAPAGASVLRLRVDGVEVDSGLDTPTVPAGGIVAAESFNIGRSWGGTLELYAQADVGTGAGDDVDEEDESNNWLIESIVVTPPSQVVVQPDGSGDFATIQAAVDALPDGVAILLGPGTYTGAGNRDVNLRGKALDIRSAYGQEGLSVIDCQAGPDEPHRAFYFNAYEGTGTRLYGLTIRNGWMPGGGGLFVGSASPVIERCVIADCGAEDGGAVLAYSAATTHALFLRCTLFGNAAGRGGAFFLSGSVGVELDACILAENSSYGGPVYYEATPDLLVGCSDIYGNGGGDYVGLLAGWAGTNGNISADPLFCDAELRDFTLHLDSPCHTYQNAPCGWVGALEEGCGAAGQHVYLVRPDGSGDFATIQEALFAAGDGDVVELGDGVFSGLGNVNLDPLGKAVTLRSRNGDPAACIIDCEGLWTGLTCYNGEGPETRFEDFTVRDGLSNLGPGFNCGTSSPTLRNLVFEGCHATSDGGVAQIAGDCSPTFENCRFLGNVADGRGGVAWLGSLASPSFLSCEFVGNTASTGGGAVFAEGASPTFDGCRFENNASGSGGGAVALWSGAGGAIADCVFLGNSAGGGGAVYYNDFVGAFSGNVLMGNSASWGGALYCANSADVVFASCTLYANEGTAGGAALSNVGSAPSFDHCILSGQVGPGATVYCTGGGSVSLSCSDVHGNAGGDWVDCLAGQLGINGNLSASPIFCGVAAPEDLALHSSSPCAPDAGACGLIGALPVACGPVDVIIRPDGSGDYPTIQAAVDACGDGSTIRLADGVFAGEGNRDVLIADKELQIRSLSGNAATCVIDCGGSSGSPHRGFLVSGSGIEMVEFLDITVRNAWHSYGGGLFADGGYAELGGVRFESCSSSDGGGIFAQNGAVVMLLQCRFEGNSASNAGGGMRASSGAHVQVNECRFEGNYGHYGGGALYCQAALLSVMYSEFVGNSSAVWGGALHYQDVTSTTSLFSSTFYGNAAPSGGVVFLRGGSDLSMDRCILAGSTEGAAAYCESGSTLTLSCSDVWGNAGGDWVGCLAGQDQLADNLHLDPRFCDPGAGGISLEADSPCAPAGNPACGLIGASGVGCGFTHLVLPDGSGDFPTIQAAIDAASHGDSILLGEGSFTGPGNRDLDTQGKRIVIRGSSDGELLSTIDAGGSAAAPHRAFHFQGDETVATRVEDLIVTGGHAADGGGILCTAASPTLSGIEFRSNTADNFGGGLACIDHASPHVQGGLLFGNGAGAKGGGLLATDFSSPTVSGVRFEANDAGQRGGGAIFTVNSFPTVTGCDFLLNDAPEAGGLAFVYAYGSVSDCLFTGNVADDGAGVYCRGNAKANFTRCTIVGNTASGPGGAMSVLVGSDPTLEACLLAFNGGDGAVDLQAGCSLAAGCTDIFGNEGGDWTGDLAGQLGQAGNVAVDPVFCGEGIYTLDANSPCLPDNNACSVQIGALGEGCTNTEAGPPPPAQLVLAHNHPNPFNPSTSLRFGLPEPGIVDLAVFDLAGRCVRELLRDKALAAGYHEVVWDGRDDAGGHQASGVYFAVLRAQGHRLTRKLTLLK